MPRRGPVPAAAALHPDLPVPAIPAHAAEAASATGGACGHRLRLRLRGRHVRNAPAAVRSPDRAAGGLFAFFTRNFVLGTSLDCPATSTAGYDNLTGPLAGSFERIRSCSCENLEVSGQIYYPIPICAGGTETPCCAEGPAFDAGEVPLCALTAVAFTIPAAEGETTPTDYDQLKGLLWQALHPGRPGASGSTPRLRRDRCRPKDRVADGRSAPGRERGGARQRR